MWKIFLDDAWRDTMLLKIAILLSPRMAYLDLTEILSKFAINYWMFHNLISLFEQDKVKSQGCYQGA